MLNADHCVGGIAACGINRNVPVSQRASHVIIVVVFKIVFEQKESVAI